MEQFDAIIIGTGQAGNPLTSVLAEKEYHTAVIERSNPGGGCINYGCTPTKTMVASASAHHMAKRTDEVGIHVNSVQTNFQQLKRRRDDIVQQWREGIAKRMSETKNLEFLI